MVLMCLMFAGFSSLIAQSVNIEYDAANKLNKNFYGVSAANMYSILQGDYNEATNMYDITFFGDGIIDELVNLDLNTIRFPGGTISQYYHFYNSTGYGSQNDELFCRAGYLPVVGMEERLSTDYLYSENHIVPFAKMIKELETRQNRAIEVLYVINIMTHFFQGDFIPANPFIDSLIVLNAGSLSDKLDESMTETSLDELEAASQIAADVMRDTTIELIKAYLLNQDGFANRFTENLMALQFLDEKDVDVKGIEIGNESYSFTMLLDDDLSEIPFDCTTPDSIIQSYGNIELSLKARLQGLIKYILIAEMYNDAVKSFFDMETGVVIGASNQGVNNVGLDSFYIRKYTGADAKFKEVWNRALNKFDFFDAYIPHMYMQPQPDCEILEAFSTDALSTYIKARSNFYFDEVIPFQMANLLSFNKNKPFWATEWNINQPFVFSNTFAQASHTFQFLNRTSHLQNEYNLELLTYHQLVGWNFNRYALIRPEPIPAENISYFPIRQAMYHAFDFTKQLFNEEWRIVDIDFSNWLPEEIVNNRNIHLWVYLSPDNTQLAINFLNTSNIDFSLDLTRRIDLNANGSNDVIQHNIENYVIQILDAESMLSSNRGCDEYPQYFDDYTVQSYSDAAQNAAIAAKSLGNIVLDLKQITTSTIDNLSQQQVLYPNPANDAFRIKDAPNSKIERIRLTTTLGKQVKNWSFATNKSYAIDGLENGSYLVQLLDSKGNLVGVKKLIVLD